ncbi:MAG: DNA double-strand break repair nuclease NurA [Candidatus Aenigmatarchaeota archaeon]|nr:DNA double-strand break repair nuclease NurA [Candidatus Aenigmarchaeota archaeon]
MHELLGQLAGIAEKIKHIEGNRQKLGIFLREIAESADIAGDDVLEPKLIYKVIANPLTKARIVGIDGGLSQHAYHGIDLILTRAVATIFDYTDGKLTAVNYWPSAIVTPTLIVISDPYSDEEWAASSSLERQRGEIDTAVNAFKIFNPNLLLLDGSVVPHGNDRPAKGSATVPRYRTVLNSFNALYATAGDRLAGCVEDSRGRRFCEIVGEKILANIKRPIVPELQKILAGTRDTNLLFHMLTVGERTCIFRYAKAEHPILTDLGVENRIFCFYLKTAEFDRPIRVEFYSEPDKAIETAERIASFVLPLCCHSGYGFPVPLIEADVRAKLAERDVSILHDQLVDRVGITPGLLKLRRESRPL